MDRLQLACVPRLAALFVLLALVQPAAADETVSLRPLDETWAARLGEAAEALQAVRVRYQKADAAYVEASHSKHPRGEALEAIVTEREAARAADWEAQQRMPELVEEARREGVYAEVLRPYWHHLERGTAPADLR